MMGIYIKGMEIPKAQTRFIIFADGRVEDEDDSAYKYSAVPVPDHGRLGDLDRILEIIDGIWDCNDMVFRPNDHCCNVPEDCKGCKWVETKNYIRGMVANAPTIILAEEKKV